MVLFLRNQSGNFEGASTRKTIKILGEQALALAIRPLEKTLLVLSIIRLVTNESAYPRPRYYTVEIRVLWILS